MTRFLTKPLGIALGLFLVVYGAAAVKRVAFINQAKCVKCGTCSIVCPVKAPQKTEEDGKITSVVIDVKKCVGCLKFEYPKCLKKCPKKAISMVDPKDIIDGKLIEAAATDGISAAKAAAPTEKSNEARQSNKAVASGKQ